MKKNTLTTTDIHLFLAKALPWYKRFYISLLICLDKDVKQRVDALKEENRLFQSNEMVQLKQKLFAHRSAPAISSEKSSLFSFNTFLKPALAFGLICILSVSLLINQNKQPDSLEYVAKGSGLGVSLYQKDREHRLLTTETIALQINDTLQIAPIAQTEQYFALYTKEANNSITQIFPEHGETMELIDSTRLPPSLIFDGVTTQLICVSSQKKKSLLHITSLLHAHGLNRSDTKPTSLLIENLYIQQFHISQRGSHD